MTEIERKAAKALFPYFSKSPVIVDVGSNKGDWAEVLCANVEKCYLFEPNTILRHYSQVRFRALKNIVYSEMAVSDKVGHADFMYWEDEHDGLSNIIGNDKWGYLKPQEKTVNTVNLDFALSGEIDLLKIDVEGAELSVIEGARLLLNDKKVKFIQIEYAEHIHVTGHYFDEIVDFVREFGYEVFHFDGERFIPCTDDLKKYNAENFYFMDKNFSENWNLEFIENTRGMRCDFVLEIGCFEGLTSRYICDNLLNTGGRIICVDPLTDEYLPGHKDNEMFKGQYERFLRNTKGYPIELIRKKSADAFEEMFHYRFNLIYVDGDHTEDAVYRDAQIAFQLCRVGGFILFDDYEGYDPGTKRGIDRFFSGLPHQKFNVERRGYQLMIKKYENLD